MGERKRKKIIKRETGVGERERARERDRKTGWERDR